MVKLVRVTGSKSDLTASLERKMELVIRMSIAGPGALALNPATTALEIPVIVQRSMMTRADDGGAYALAFSPMKLSAIRQRRRMTCRLNTLIPFGSSAGLTWNQSRMMQSSIV